MAATEKNELLKEIAFLSKLIHSHKQQSSHVQPSVSPTKWKPSSSAWVNKQRCVIKPRACVNQPCSFIQTSPLRQLPVEAKSTSTRRVVPARQHVIAADSKVAVLGFGNTAVRTSSSTGSRTVAIPQQPKRSRSVLVSSPVKNKTLNPSSIPKAARSVLTSSNELKLISTTTTAASPLKVTVCNYLNNYARSVTTAATAVSHSVGDRPNRTVIRPFGLESKSVRESVSSESCATINSSRIVCDPPLMKPASRVVLKPTAYKWAAEPKLPVVKTTVTKSSFTALVSPSKFTKLNNSSNTLSLLPSRKQLPATVPKMTQQTVVPANPLMTSTPMMRSSQFVRTPSSNKVLKKTVKTKYKLVRKSTVKTDRKLVRNLYTWFNSRPETRPATTPRLKRKVGKYSLRYVKPNRTLKKAHSLPPSSYRYNSRSKVQKIRPQRILRSRFSINSASVSSVRNRMTQKYKFFKRDAVQNSPKASLKKNLSTKLVMIGGILYKSSKNKLARTVRNSPVVKVSRLDAKKVKIISVRGVKFRMDSSGKTLQRIHHSTSNTQSLYTLNNTGAAARHNASFSRLDLGGITYVEKRPGVLVKSLVAQKRTMASQVVNRSIHRLVAANKKSSQYCMFFNRFGKCHKKESGNCPYRHDADKVAVCTRFLQGGCTLENCLFSHKVCRTKMPACSFFLEGRCSSDDCPYLHVNVNPKAEVCKDFLKGYCALAEKCKKRHTYVCPEFQQTGKCEKGKKCFLQHASKPKRRKSTGVNADPIPAPPISSEESVAKKRKLEEVDEDDKNLPFKERRLPSFIKLDDSEDEENLDSSGQLAIRPGATSPLGTKPKD